MVSYTRLIASPILGLPWGAAKIVAHEMERSGMGPAIIPSGRSALGAVGGPSFAPPDPPVRKATKDPVSAPASSTADHSEEFGNRAPGGRRRPYRDTDNVVPSRAPDRSAPLSNSQHPRIDRCAQVFAHIKIFLGVLYEN